ncbi:MAG: hypothetical protein IT172_11640 [Acidobacteria bacterium]|nr:hypothetical protein [Acidobacteriota bacterium]
MIHVVKCPSCGAPLKFDESHIKECEFCGNKLSSDTPGMVTEDMAGFDGLVEQAQKLKEILRLARNGQKLDAIKLYREAFGGDLGTAKDAVEKLAAGQAVAFQTSDIHVVQHGDHERAVRKGARLVGILALLPFLIGSVAAIGGVGTAIWAVYKAVGKFSGVTGGPFSTGGTTMANEILRIGGQGVGPGYFDDNRVVGVDADGKLYSADYSGGRVQVFDRSGKFLTQWMAGNKSPYIGALGVSRNGRVYLALAGGLASFDGMTGKALKQAGSGNVSDIAVMPNGKVVTVDSDTISIYDQDLKRLAIFKGISDKAGIKSGFDFIAVNGIEEIYAVGRSGGDVAKFSADGKFVDRFKVKPTSVNSIAVDPKGRVFLSETSKIWAYQTNGELMGSFDAQQAFGMAFDDRGILFAASRPYVVGYAVN